MHWDTEGAPRKVPEGHLHRCAGEGVALNAASHFLADRFDRIG